jgi:excisionase family DNA binding protein
VAEDSKATITPRLFDVDPQAATYLGCSADTVNRLIDNGSISLVKLPAARGKSGATCRRRLVDRFELDALIERWKEKRS